MIKDPRLYATVPLRETVTPAPRKKKATVVEIRKARTKEKDTKKSIDRTHAVLTRLEDRIEAYNEQIADLRRQIAAIDRRKGYAGARHERIEDEAIRRIDAAGLKKADGNTVTFTLKPCPAALEVDDESKLPPEFMREKVTITVDKVAIKAALAPVKGESEAEHEQRIAPLLDAVHLTQRISLVRK